MGVQVKSVQFYPDGTTVFEYLEVPGDFRENGMALSRGVMVPPEVPAVIDELDDLNEAAQRALRAVVREFSSSRALDGEELVEHFESEVEESGPGYDNPNERETVR